MREEHGLSITKACSAFHISRTVYAYQPSARDDTLVIKALLELAEAYPRYGFPKYFELLRRKRFDWNHKSVHRVYAELQLHLRRKGKRRLPSRQPVRLKTQAAINCCWSVDFMCDSLMRGQRFRTFNVIDDFSREALAIEVDTNLPAARVIRVLERIAA